MSSAFPFHGARGMLTRRQLLLATGAISLGSGVAHAAATALPTLPLRVRQLANGLGVYALPDDSTPTVSVQVWYRVGGKDDPTGRSGFAHLFEHMMFKGTAHMPSEMMDRLTEDVGGYNNAFTAEDVTAYQSLVPLNHLERLLWAEAERMASLQINQATFASERAVVQEEYRERVLAGPYGRLFNAIPSHGFSEHPYRRPVIGSIEDLDAATLDDVRRFHATYYRPDNAALIVAGAFEPAQLDAWVDRYFGRLRAPQGDIPRVLVREKRRTQSQRVALHGPNVPLPAVAVLWQGPAASAADAKALQVAAALLAAGDACRLNETLVYRDQIAQNAGFQADLYADAGLLTAFGIVAERHTAAQVEAALRREVLALVTGRISTWELERVRNQLVTQALLGRQRPDGQCEAVGWALTQYGDAWAADRELRQLQSVTAAQVQQTLKRHVLGQPSVTLNYTQAAT